MSVKSNIKLVIADDHPIVREGLQAMFECRGGFSVVASVESAEEAISWCVENGVPDVLLSDVRMPGKDGFALLSELREKFPSAKVLLLAGLPNGDEEEKARNMGACGYISKGTNIPELAAAVTRLANGNEEFVTDEYKSVETPFAPRERETLKYLALGKTRDEIAIILGCSPQTIKCYIKNIHVKLDVNNTPAAIARAYELGYLRA